LLQEKNGDMAAQTKLHQAKYLEKYILRKAAKWSFRGDTKDSLRLASSSSGIGSCILSPVPELELDGA